MSNSNISQLIEASLLKRDLKLFKFKFFKNAIFTWKYFHLSEKKLHIIAWHLQNEEVKSIKFSKSSIIQLNSLNNKKIDIQKEIGNITKYNNTCKKCGGECCQGDYNHFTVLDYLIRKYSKSPVNKYGKIWKPPNIYSLLKNKLKSFFATQGLFKRFLERTNDLDVASRCPDLTEERCIFSPEDRPMRCIVWTCRAFRRKLQHDDFCKLAYDTKKLQIIGYEIFKLYKKKVPVFKTLFQYWICALFWI